MKSSDQANPKTVVCVTGWHFEKAFYSQVCQIKDADVFIVSHKKKPSVPQFIFEFLPENHVIFKENVGYDWGCYQQFLETGIWKNYEFVFFIHDDVKILDLGFVNRCIDLLSKGFAVVGNGRNNTKRDWPLTHAERYAHSRWVPPSMTFLHDTVRGSFFSTTKTSLLKIISFEVFWDKFHLNLRFGNYSLTATCGKIHDIFGENAFAFLSDTYLESAFLMEEERGSIRGYSLQENVGWKRYFLQKIYPRFVENSRKYVYLRMKTQLALRDRIFIVFHWFVTFLGAGR